MGGIKQILQKKNMSEVAKKLKNKGLDPKDISEVTGLTIKEIEKL